MIGKAIGSTVLWQGDIPEVLFRSGFRKLKKKKPPYFVTRPSHPAFTAKLMFIYLFIHKLSLQRNFDGIYVVLTTESRTLIISG